MTKNVLFLTASFAALFAVGCSGDDEGTKTGDTATTPTGDDDDDDTPVAANTWDDASLANGISCAGGTVDFDFDFLGDAGFGWLDAADTANASNWNDAHTLDAVGFDEDGLLTELAASLTTGAGVGDWADGVSTVFDCDLHYNDVVMSYIARAYDLDGELADCAAWGDDAAGFLAGDYSTNPIADDGELAGCRTISAAK